MKQALVERMLYIVLAVVFVGAGILAYFNAQAADKLSQQQKVLQQQVASQKEVLKGIQELLANQGKTTKDINKSLSCILVFFSSPDRAKYYISDLATCTITNTDTGKTEILPLPQPSPTAQSQPTPSDQSSNQAPSSQGSTQQPATPTTPTPSVSNPPQTNPIQYLVNGTIGIVKSIVGGVNSLLERK